MPTFTRILNVFEDKLREDPLYEVVSTSHGYTLLAWDEHRHQWYNAKLLGNERDDLTEQEEEEIEARCQRLRDECLLR